MLNFQPLIYLGYFYFNSVFLWSTKINADSSVQDLNAMRDLKFSTSGSLPSQTFNLNHPREKINYNIYMIEI